MRLLDELTDFLFDPVPTVRFWVVRLKLSDPVTQWQLRGKLVRFWLQSGSERRRWWESLPVLFGPKWDEYYRNLRSEAEAVLKQGRWWENHTQPIRE